MVKRKISQLMNVPKRFFCSMGWHSFFVGYEDPQPVEGDNYGIATKYKCKWCEFRGLVDSQGNLF